MKTVIRIPPDRARSRACAYARARGGAGVRGTMIQVALKICYAAFCHSANIIAIYYDYNKTNIYLTAKITTLTKDGLGAASSFPSPCRKYILMVHII